jgi:hypothetical protein
VLALVMRGAFALAAQALVAAGFRLRRRPDPWRAAAGWWPVHSSLADLGCLAVLAWLLRREGRGPGDLLGIERGRLGADIKDGLGDVVALAAAGGISSALQRPFYAGGFPPLITVARGLPRWARAYALLAWPALWVATEELVYLGYALPRLEAQTGGRRLAAALVILCWGPLQHPALPALGDRRYVAFRALTALPPIATQVAYYLARGRRLPPLILGHWVADLATGAMIAFQPRTGE